MVWQDRPFRVGVQAGEQKAFCRCGKTDTAPYCDGSHKGTGIEPCIQRFDEDKTVSICGCGRSGAMPLCDGAHKQ